MSIVKRSDGKYDVQVWYKDVKGQRRHTSKCGFTYKRDAEKWQRLFLEGDHVEKATMATVIKQYIANLDAEYATAALKLTTLTTKKDYINAYILPYFEDVKLVNINSNLITDWLATITPCKKHKSGRLSSSTVLKACSELKAILKLAKRSYGYVGDAFQDVKMPQKFTNDKRAECWTQEQFDKFISVLKSDYDKALFSTLWYAGLRRGEALGFYKEDILNFNVGDIECYGLNIDKNHIEIKSGLEYISTPKTIESKRIVYIPKSLYDMLMKHCEVYRIEKGERVFDINIHTLRDRLDAAIAKAELPHISTHTLRHSYASATLNRTKDAVLVASQLGHRDASTLIETYAHLLDNAKVQYIKALSETTNGTED